MQNGSADSEESVRRRLLEEATNSVHEIQSEYERGRVFLVKNELAESLCCVLEAIFLHGIRHNSLALKFTSAFGLSKNAALENISFWNLVCNVSHRDVIDSITSAKNTKSEVAKCRVWIRLALNESLLQSYLVAIGENGDLNQSYYQPWAFLRDKDSVDILSNIMLGLQNFTFKFDLDTELGKWSPRTMFLCGLVREPTKPTRSLTSPPALAPVHDSPQNDTAEDGPEELTVIRVQTRKQSPVLAKPIPNSNQTDSELNSRASPRDFVSPLQQYERQSIQSEDRIDHILRYVTPDLDTTNGHPETVTPETPQPTVDVDTAPSRPEIRVSSPQLDVPSVRLEAHSDGESSRHSGSNQLLPNAYTGWSSPYQGDHLERARKIRSDTEDSFDNIIARGMGSIGFSSSLGIGQSAFADMVRKIESASSTTTTPTLSNNDTDLDMDYEVVDGKDVVANRRLEGKKRELLVKIPTEKGLRSQHYKCGGCQRPIAVGLKDSRLCHFDLLYYCFECHVNDESMIPSRVIHNWDFRKYEVCTRARELIEAVESSPCFNIQELNPKLYANISQMAELQAARVQLQIVKSYLWTCKKSVFEQFNQKLWPHDHLHESQHLYSLSDLVLTFTGQLHVKIKAASQFGIDHVRKCMLCSQKGFICEVCRAGQVLHAFDTKENYQCLKCYAVFHKKCMDSTKDCPKCLRKERYAQRLVQNESL